MLTHHPLRFAVLTVLATLLFGVAVQPSHCQLVLQDKTIAFPTPSSIVFHRGLNRMYVLSSLNGEPPLGTGGGVFNGTTNERIASFPSFQDGSATLVLDEATNKLLVPAYGSITGAFFTFDAAASIDPLPALSPDNGRVNWWPSWEPYMYNAWSPLGGHTSVAVNPNGATNLATLPNGTIRVALGGGGVIAGIAEELIVNSYWSEVQLSRTAGAGNIAWDSTRNVFYGTGAFGGVPDLENAQPNILVLPLDSFGYYTQADPISVPLSPTNIAVNPNNGRVYVLHYWDAKITIIDPYDLDLGGQPRQITLDLVDPKTNAPVTHPAVITVTPSDTIYVTALGELYAPPDAPVPIGNGSLLILDGTKINVNGLAPDPKDFIRALSVGEWPDCVCVGNRYVYVGNWQSDSISVIDPSAISSDTPTDSDGKVTVAANGNTSLTFPAGTSSGTTTIAPLSGVPVAPASGFSFAGTYFDITSTVASAQIKAGVTVSVAYDPIVFPWTGPGDITNPKPVLVHYMSDGTTEQSTDSDIHLASHTVTLEVTSFSPFALFGTTAPVYATQALYDQTKAYKSGSTAPIKVRLIGYAGANVSSSAITLTATAVRRISSNAPGTLADSGNSNPDNNFRYDATLGGYIYNLSLKGYSTGTYALSFKAGSDPVTHTVQFEVK